MRRMVSKPWLRAASLNTNPAIHTCNGRTRPTWSILDRADYPIPTIWISGNGRIHPAREYGSVYKAPFRPGALTDGQRKLLLSLLLKASQKQSFDPCQSAGGKTPLLTS